MKEIDDIKKLYVDGSFQLKISRDDFLIAIGKNKSNSIYHVLEVKKKIRENGIRYYLKVLKSDLITCIKREQHQRIITLTWYDRNKKDKVL